MRPLDGIRVLDFSTLLPGPMASLLLAEAGADVNARSGIIAWERQRTSEPRDKWLPPGGFTPLLFAAVVVLSFLGVLLFNAVAFAERIALPWSRVATDVAE